MATGVSTTTYTYNVNSSSITLNIPTTINGKETKLVSARMKFVGRNKTNSNTVYESNGHINMWDEGEHYARPTDFYNTVEPSLPVYSTRLFRTMYANVRCSYDSGSISNCVYLSATVSKVYTDAEWDADVEGRYYHSIVRDSYRDTISLDVHWLNEGWTDTDNDSSDTYDNNCLYWTSTDGDMYSTYYRLHYNVVYETMTYNSSLSFLDTSFSTSYYSVLDTSESSPWQSIPIEKLHLGDNNLQISLPTYRYVDVVIEYEYKLTPTIFANVDGIWKEADDVSVNVDGIWKTVTSLHSNIDGTWRES